MQKKFEWTKIWSLVKNPQFLSNQANIQLIKAILSTHELSSQVSLELTRNCRVFSNSKILSQSNIFCIRLSPRLSSRLAK